MDPILIYVFVGLGAFTLGLLLGGAIAGFLAFHEGVEDKERRTKL